MAESLGMVQVRGLACALRAANLAANTAAVTVAGFAYMHEGQVVVTLRGAVDSVRAAVDAVLGGLGPEAVTAHSVIGRVVTELDPMLSERTVRVGSRVGAPVVPGRGRAYTGPATPDSDPPADRTGPAAATDGGRGRASGPPASPPNGEAGPPAPSQP